MWLNAIISSANTQCIYCLVVPAHQKSVCDCDWKAACACDNILIMYVYMCIIISNPSIDVRDSTLEFLQLNTTTETCLSIISLDYPAHLSVHFALSTPATQQLLATPGFSFVGAATEEQSVSAYYKVQMRGTGELVVTAYGTHSADAHCIGMYINHVVHLRVIDKEPRVTST
jgi:hypothetical protein